jgi:uncharacterized protein YjbI with pentapeptide repeats
MADRRHLEALQRGALDWNVWLADERRKDYAFRPDLSGADLRGRPLEFIDLSRANLSGANLDGANLRHGSLALANLTRTTLSGAGLRTVDLWYAQLDESDFRDADLFHAAFGSDRTDLSQARLTGTQHGNGEMAGTTVGVDTILATCTGLRRRPHRRDEVTDFLVRCGIPADALHLLLSI